MKEFNLPRFRDIARRRGWALDTRQHDAKGVPWISARWSIGSVHGTVVINVITGEFYGSRRPRQGVTEPVRFTNRTATLERSNWFTCLRSFIRECITERRAAA